MILPGEPDFEFSQVIGTGFNQDAFDDGESLEEIIDGYSRWRPVGIREASATGHRLLSEGHDDSEMEKILRGFGFWLLPEPLGFAGYTEFLEHLVGRLDGFIAGLPPQAFVIPEVEPMRELAEAEREALSALLNERFAAGSDEEYKELVGGWSGRQPVARLRDARSAVNALREGPLLDDALTAILEGMGLGYDLWEWDHLGAWGFLEAISNELSRALGEPLYYDEVFEAPEAEAQDGD
jgi:hypothetical protein